MPPLYSVGRPKHVRVMAGALEGDVFIGRKAQEYRGLLKIKYPMEHGIVTDWDDMERIWSWVYAEELGTLSEEASRPIFLHGPLAHPFAASSVIDRSTIESTQQQGYRCTDILRHIQCPGTVHFSTGCTLTVCTPVPPKCALPYPRPRYSSGRTTGIVLDSGDGVTHAVPVFEGFSMPHAIRRVDIAGRCDQRFQVPVSQGTDAPPRTHRDVTDHLQLLLRKAGHHLHTTAELEVVRTIKEKSCYIALNPQKEEKESASRTEDFKLPDGNTIQVNGWTLGCYRHRSHLA